MIDAKSLQKITFKRLTRHSVQKLQLNEVMVVARTANSRRAWAV